MKYLSYAVIACMGSAAGFIWGYGGMRESKDEALVPVAARRAPDHFMLQATAVKRIPDSLVPEKIMDYCRSCSRDELGELAKRLFSTGEAELNTLEGKASLAAFFGRWGEVDPRAALAFAQRMTYYGDVRHEIIKSWGNVSLQEALAFLELEDKDGTLWQQGDLRAENSLEESLAWALALPEKGRASALCAVLPIMARSEPERAARIAVENQVESVRADIALHWGRQDWQKAMDWAGSFSGWYGDLVRRDAYIGALSAYPETAVKHFRFYMDTEKKRRQSSK